MANKKTPGEATFEAYLNGQKVPFDYEPPLSFTSKRVDYVLDHPEAGKIYLDVKDINELPISVKEASRGPIDMYDTIRRHIVELKEKFKDFDDQKICAGVLFNANGTWKLESPMIMLGAMYGNGAFGYPIDPEHGGLDSSKAEWTFIVGGGKMVRSREKFRNTRIAALISLVPYSAIFAEIWQPYRNCKDLAPKEIREKTRKFYADVYSHFAKIEASWTYGCTVWENCTAKQRLPQDLFRGPMDAWWTCENGRQRLSFIGEQRRSLGIDGRDRNSNTP